MWPLVHGRPLDLCQASPSPPARPGLCCRPLRSCRSPPLPLPLLDQPVSEAGQAPAATLDLQISDGLRGSEPAAYSPHQLVHERLPPTPRGPLSTRPPPLV